MFSLFTITVYNHGMSQRFSKKFYRSKQWADVRDLVIKRDKGLCQRCARRGRMTAATEVHHITPLTPDNIGIPSITLNPDNLTCLCHDCHQEIHRELGIGASGAKPRGDEPRVGFDVYGNVVRLED